MKLAPRESWGFLEQEDRWDRRGSQEHEACRALQVQQASMGGMETREPKVTEVFRDRRGKQERKVILGLLVTSGGKEQRAYMGSQDALAHQEPRAPREKLAVLENQESQDQMGHLDQRANKEHQVTMVPRGFLGRKEKRGPREFLAWEASKDKWGGLERLELLDQMDLKGPRANQGHRAHEEEEGDLRSASEGPLAWTGKKEKRVKMVLLARREKREILVFLTKR